MSWKLWGASPQCSVMALAESTPTLRWKLPQGDAAVFSATQNAYFAGPPCVDASPGPGTAPATCSRIKRSARPVVALARLPGPNAPSPLLYPARSAISPCTIINGATGCVVALTPRRLSFFSPRARVAATSTGMYSGRQPASAALTATMRRVALPNRGGNTASTSSGPRPQPSSMASTRADGGATNGKPSPQPSDANGSHS